MRRQDVVLAPARDQKARAFREARRSGFLSLPARGLTEFPREVYHLEEHMDKDEKKWECVDLVKIDMSHNAIPSIAGDIAGLTTVTSMKLCQNVLTALPEGFFELTGLTYLDLSHNQLQQDLSESLGVLINLRELGLAANKLTSLPQSLGRLAQLEVLRIEENAITRLPESIGSLQKLHTLTAYSNQLTSLPASLSGLRNMQMLDLKKNRLESTFECLSTLQQLKFLDLRQNRLVIFPVLPVSAALDQVFIGYNVLSSIDEASVLCVKDSITVLDVRDNKLSELPANIACLYRLKTLDLSNNDLSDLPPGLGYLKHLNHIVIDGNPLRAIRRSILSAGCESLKKYLRTRGSPPVDVDVLAEEIDELQAYHNERNAAKAGNESMSVADASCEILFRDAASSGTLDFSEKGVAELPSTLRKQCNDGGYNFAATLLHLNLSKNRLTHLPTEIGLLTALLTLTVEDNRLQSVDASIASLQNLQLLRVRKNQLTQKAINDFLGDDPLLSHSLKELDLRNNALTQMPLGTRYLHSMETLLLSFNKIDSLDGFPWSELTKMSVVSISDNKLRSLGTIYHIPRLASLSFENNNLTNVPYELGLCPHLRAIYMNGNPQKTVRGGVIAKGSTEILMYLKNKLPPNTSLPPVPPVPKATLHLKRDNQAEEEAQARLKTPPTALVTSRPGNSKSAMYAASGPAAGGSQEDLRREEFVARSASTNAVQHKEVREDKDASQQMVNNLTKQIHRLELELENHALSAPKRYAMKKELAVLRSAKIREERKLA
uniref:Disease resistance R13L4/SHOC-2-like LRR domain-containing protein n=1 Tax=Globisporangium ultimum (strain ATCC 200006 / CBS 805.95 / DAOM BR144) TaxID=431595 RepID=K3X9W3_GLOUD